MDVEDVDSARDYAALPDDAAEQQVQVAGTKLYANPEYQQPLTPEEVAAREKRAQRFARFGPPTASIQSQAPQEHGPSPANLESFTQLRPNALHVQSDSIQQLDTHAILRWATTFVRKDELKGMEWINDVCCCLIFVDPVAAASGLHALLTDPSFFTSLGPALSRLEDIYTEPDTADLQLVATPKPAHGLQGSTPAWIRFALLQDRKSRNARDESRFYAEQRAHQHHDHRPPPARATQDLDAELEAYTAGEDSGSRRREDHARRRGGRRHSPRGDRDVELDRLDRFDGRHQTAHARQSGLAALDAELDSYLGQESPTASTSQQHSSATTPIELFPSLSGFRSDALAQGTHPVNSSFSSPTGLAPEQQQRSLFSRISPESVSSSSLPQPSGKPDLFGDSTNAAQRARPKAADLFSDQGNSAQSSGSGGMRGWDD